MTDRFRIDLARQKLNRLCKKELRTGSWGKTDSKFGRLRIRLDQDFLERESKGVPALSMYRILDLYVLLIRTGIVREENRTLRFCDLYGFYRLRLRSGYSLVYGYSIIASIWLILWCIGFALALL